MRARGRVAIDRDQDASPFSAILWRLCEGCSAHAAALVDKEGETVGLRRPHFSLRNSRRSGRAPARARLHAQRPSTGLPPSQRDPHSHRTAQLRGRPPLGDGYAIVLELVRHSFAVSPRAVLQATRELESEAGIESVLRPGGTRWSRVEVRASASDARRPDAVWLNGAWQAVTVLGRYRSGDLARRERGYLARLANGAECSLVREPLGFWFADELSLNPGAFRQPRPEPARAPAVGGEPAWTPIPVRGGRAPGRASRSRPTLTPLAGRSADQTGSGPPITAQK